MIQTTSMILEQLQDYANPRTKLSRLVREKKYFSIINGLYETEEKVAGHLLAGSIYGPSYLSFAFALAYHGLIPEMVYSYTSATFCKKKKKNFHTDFGHFTYRDVPPSVYPLGVQLVFEGDYTFQIATPEKALCDQLYTMPPVKNLDEMQALLIDDMRIDLSSLSALCLADLQQLQAAYHATNVTMLIKFLRKVLS